MSVIRTRALLLAGPWSALIALAVLGCNPQTSVAPVPIASQAPISTVPVLPPFDDISLKCQGQRVPVLMFHDIIAKRDRNSVWFDCSADEFQKIVDTIKDQGITPLSLDQLYRHLTLGEQVPEKSIVLTFDDNYQGFYDHAWPILKQNSFPAVVFVHTGYVGDKTGTHPKMSWSTLQELVKDPLITIGSHTITHPADITAIDHADQVKELQESKATLEQHLGIKIKYFAYPDGKNDSAVQQLCKTSGYLMAFSIHNGLAEESPNIYCVDRYIHTRFQTALDDVDKAVRGAPAGVFDGPLKPGPIAYKEGEFAGVKLGFITGGTPITILSPTREGVLDLIHRTPGTVAGINGGFFAMAAVAATDNSMVGPLKTHDMPQVLGDNSPERWEKLRDRPLILWGPTRLAILPYQPDSMGNDAAFKDFMPDITDTFMAGVWLVHGGVARTREDMDLFAAKDIEDPRRRSFIGTMPDGTFVCGASLESASSEKLAAAIAEAGLSESVLLDSGFSTSLVYGESIKASGHSTKTMPSRPIPHAILLQGQLDPATASLGAPDLAPPVEEAPQRRHRRRR